MYRFSSDLFTGVGNSLRRAFAHSSRSNHRKGLPPKLSENVVRLKCKSAAKDGICDVYVVGTAHGSEESCQQVKDVINFLKPQAVFLELCLPRYSRLIPGAKCEFRVGDEEAKKYGAMVVPGDRCQFITCRRAWAKMSLWHQTKTFVILPYILVFCSREIDKSGINKLIQKMTVVSPVLMETIVDERDQYMSALLFKLARKHNTVVAVVGRGHLSGIQKYWKQPIDVKPLLVIPPNEKIITFGMVLTVVICWPLIILATR